MEFLPYTKADAAKYLNITCKLFYVKYKLPIYENQTTEERLNLIIQDEDFIEFYNNTQKLLKNSSIVNLGDLVPLFAYYELSSLKENNWDSVKNEVFNTELPQSEYLLFQADLCKMLYENKSKAEVELDKLTTHYPNEIGAFLKEQGLEIAF